MKALILITIYLINPVLLPFSCMQWNIWLKKGKKMHCAYCFLLLPHLSPAPRVRMIRILAVPPINIETVSSEGRK